jgi:hypothetical protein
MPPSRNRISLSVSLAVHPELPTAACGCKPSAFAGNLNAGVVLTAPGSVRLVLTVAFEAKELGTGLLARPVPAVDASLYELMAPNPVPEASRRVAFL